MSDVRYGDCDSFPPGSVPVCSACRKPYLIPETPVYVGERHYHKACVPTAHDEDVRLVRELTLYPIQPYPARGATANAAFGRILARYDALMREHEAVALLKDAWEIGLGVRGASEVVIAAHDKVEGMLAESTQQSHDVMTTSDREEQT